jgi:hypothetical protein
MNTAVLRQANDAARKLDQHLEEVGRVQTFPDFPQTFAPKEVETIQTSQTFQTLSDSRGKHVEHRDTTTPLHPHQGEFRGLRSIASFRSKHYKYVDYLPVGQGSILFVGGNDLGKTAVWCRLAARVLLGTTEGAWNGTPKGVLVILSEDDPGKIKDVMHAHGVTDFLMERLLFTFVTSDSQQAQNGDYDTVSLPEDADFLRGLCRQYGIGMVVFDALIDSMPHARLNDRADVSRAFKPLNKWGGEDEILIVGIHHNNKGNEGNAKQAVSGSTAFTDKPRVVVSFDRTDDDRYVMQLIKVKGRPDNPSYEYTFHTRQVDSDDGSTNSVGIITDIRHSDIQLDALRAKRIASPANESKRAANGDIADWLDDYLGEDKIPFDQLRKDALSQEGYSAEQLRNARKASNGRILTMKDPDYQGRGQRFLWYRPTQPQ